MGLKISSDSGPKRELTPKGYHTAICVGYTDLGTQHSEYKGQKKVSHRVMIFWDIPGSRVEYKGKSLPRRISKRFTLSLYEKAALRKFLDLWNGGPMTREQEANFDLDSLIGRPATLQISHNPGFKDPKKVYEDVASIGPIMDGMPVPKIEAPIVKYVMEAEDGSFVIPPETLPRFIRDAISKSDEAKKAGWTFDPNATADAQADIATEAAGDDEGPVPF
jgi:hypothetical protein